MILVDSSVWVAHFRHENLELMDSLNRGLIYTHPLIIVELDGGHLPSREKTLESLLALPCPRPVELIDLVCLIKEKKWYGKKCRAIELNLLASAFLNGLLLWTLDDNLAALAKKIKVLYPCDR
jgi:predicted nucleic acid-binding protein